MSGNYLWHVITLPGLVAIVVAVAEYLEYFRLSCDIATLRG